MIRIYNIVATIKLHRSFYVFVSKMKIAATSNPIENEGERMSEKCTDVLYSIDKSSIGLI